MIKLKKYDIDGKKHIDLRGFVYDIEDETRGIRDKFWIKREPGKFLVEDNRNVSLLFKYNRNELSCEDWGEVIASKIGKIMEMEIVDYYPAEFDDGESLSRGVLCGSYIASDKQYEISGHALQTIYTDLYYDKEKERTNKPLNTVYSFIEDLKEILELPTEDKEQTLTKIKNDLLKQCLFDFLLGQTDRHWLNTSFLLYDNEGKIALRKADCYDNGCIAYLKRKRQAIKGITTEIGDDPINSNMMHMLMDKYIPMFGIKTSTVRLAPSHEGEYGTKLAVDSAQKFRLINELTDEILYNPEMAVYYTLFKERVRMDKVADMVTREGDNPPPEVIKMVDNVIKYQTNEIEKVLSKKLKKIREDRGKEW